MLKQLEVALEDSPDFQVTYTAAEAELLIGMVDEVSTEAGRLSDFCRMRLANLRNNLAHRYMRAERRARNRSQWNRLPRWERILISLAAIAGGVSFCWAFYLVVWGLQR